MASNIIIVMKGTKEDRRIPVKEGAERESIP